MLIIGTLGFVESVNLLLKWVIERNITTVEINLEKTALETKVTFYLKGKAGEILPELYKTAFG